MLRSHPRRIREICICETPICSAISLWCGPRRSEDKAPVARARRAFASRRRKTRGQRTHHAKEHGSIVSGAPDVCAVTMGGPVTKYSTSPRRVGARCQSRHRRSRYNAKDFERFGRALVTNRFRSRRRRLCPNPSSHSLATGLKPVGGGECSGRRLHRGSCDPCVVTERAKNRTAGGNVLVP